MHSRFFCITSYHCDGKRLMISIESPMKTTDLKSRLNPDRKRSKSERERDNKKPSGARHVVARRFMISHELDEYLNRAARALGVSRSLVIRQAIYDRMSKTESQYKIS